jgi:hypothetical protein
MIMTIASLIARFRESVRKDPGRFAVGSAVNDPLGLLFAEEVEHLADLDVLGDQLRTRRIDVGDDQVQVLGRSGGGCGQALAELDRACRTRRGVTARGGSRDR